MKYEDDYTMKVPKELQEMAMKIEDWFVERKIKTWKVMNVCSRNHTYEIYRLEERLHKITEVVNKKF